jgi:large subunit ribosomal protein L5
MENADMSDKEKKAPAKKRAAAPKQEKASSRRSSAEATPAQESAASPASSNGSAPPPRLRERYRAEIVPQLMEQFGYKNVMQVPKLQKIVINVGLGEAVQNPRAIDAAVEDISIITGQRPVVTRAKKSIAAFKLREGMPIGAMVTLRGPRMYEFLDRLVSMALPRIRDFRGVSPNSFDGRGNYTLGLAEQLAFPEIDYDRIDRTRGLEMSIVTSARNDEEGRQLLTLLGMPFARTEGQA